MQRPTQTVGTIACCLCGAPTPADAVADGTCMACLSVTTNIASAIEPSLEVEMCRTCGKWYRNPQWVAYEAESAELLAMCVRRVRGLRGLHLVDASWIWTEPHSRRLKVKLTVRKEVLSGTALQQSAVVEFVVRTRNCDGCNKVAAKDLWSAKVQLRQRAEHPRTLLAMEQVIRRQRLAAGAGVRRTREGLDFTFTSTRAAQTFVGHLKALAACRVTTSETVVAANAKQGTSNVRHSWLVEVVPLCREDLVVLPAPLASRLPHRLALVARIGSSVHLLDPQTGQTAEVTADAYWRCAFRAVASRARLTKFVVLDCEVAGARGAGAAASGVGDATVARESDLGTNDRVSDARTHLGALLEAGDDAFGYDLEVMLATADELEAVADLPAVVLVSKRRPLEAEGRPSGAQRRRRRRERGDRSSDRSDAGSEVSTSSYQTELDDFDDEAVDDEMREEVDALAAEFAAMHPVMDEGSQSAPVTEESLVS